MHPIRIWTKVLAYLKMARLKTDEEKREYNTFHFFYVEIYL